jgi:hypothetical protein
VMLLNRIQGDASCSATLAAHLLLPLGRRDDAKWRRASFTGDYRL